MSRQNTKVAFGVPQTRGTRSSATRIGGSKNEPGSKPSEASKKRFNIPALSIPPKIPPIDPVLEKLRKKGIRRNAPPGEDTKKIREVIKGLHKEAITVQEYVGLISPYTGDNGEVLHTVMGDDLSSFRRMAKRVYDTMTQDVSDVLGNEQIHLTEFYNERYTIFMEKMMRAIDEIYRYVPNFDFELYYEDREMYLSKLFPLPSTVNLDPEDEEMHRRQEAYHRLQWLRSEGTRLAEENAELQTRFKDLKKQQQGELMSARQQEELAEVRKTHLEATQADLQNQLQELNESVEKSFITTEEDLRLAEEAKVAKEISRKQTRKQRGSRPQTRQTHRGESWNTKTAKAMEEESFVKSATSALSSVSVVSTSSKEAVKKKPPKSKIKLKRPPPQPRERSPFHYSPIQTPPKQQERQRSPFHYSPPKTPPPPPTARGPSPTRTVRVESSTEFIQQAPQAPARQLPSARRNLAPRDTWGGFG